GELFRNIIAGDYSGAAYPVNPRGDPVGGVRAYTAVEQIGSAVDLAVVCVPGELVLEAVRSALQAGTRALCVISAGFAETGSEGGGPREELLALVRRDGARPGGANRLRVTSARCPPNPTLARPSGPPARTA